MSLAQKAGLPKVEKAYPSMALGTAEATPLQVAAGYTTFANLGEAVSPVAINRVTTGDGRVVVEPKTEKKTVLRSDVAYIMDDIMKRRLGDLKTLPENAVSPEKPGLRATAGSPDLRRNW